MPRRSAMARTRCSPSQNHDAPRSSGSDSSRPPMRGLASSTVTVRPLRCTASATANPLMPAPMTTMSDWRTCCSLPHHSSRWALCQWPDARASMPVMSPRRSLRLQPPMGSGIDGALTRETSLQTLGNDTYRRVNSRHERTTPAGPIIRYLRGASCAGARYAAMPHHPAEAAADPCPTGAGVLSARL